MVEEAERLRLPTAMTPPLPSRPPAPAPSAHAPDVAALRSRTFALSGPSAFHPPAPSHVVLSTPVKLPPPLSSVVAVLPSPLPPPPSALALPEARAFERESSIERKKRRLATPASARRKPPLSSFPSSFTPCPPTRTSSLLCGASTPQLRSARPSAASPPPPPPPRHASSSRQRLRPPATPVKTPAPSLDGRQSQPVLVFRSPALAHIVGQGGVADGQASATAPASSMRLRTPRSGRVGCTPVRPLFRPIIDELMEDGEAAGAEAAAAAGGLPVMEEREAPPLPRPPPFTSSPLLVPPSSASLFSSEFTCVRELGRGDFGVVFLCRWHRDGQLYAIKRSLRPLRTTAERQRACREVQHFSALVSSTSFASPHPNLVTLYQAWEEEHHPHIQSEYLPDGTVRDALTSADSFLPEERLWQWLSCVVDGLSFLHSHSILHLDIKPDNLFLGQPAGLKIGDLGTSTRISPDAALSGDGGRAPEEVEEGDAVYLAPELLDPSVGPVTAQADVFSLGLTMFELAADVVLPTRGAAWNDLRQEKLDWTGLSYHEGVSESPAWEARLLPTHSGQGAAGGATGRTLVAVHRLSAAGDAADAGRRRGGVQHAAVPRAHPVALYAVAAGAAVE